MSKSKQGKKTKKGGEGGLKIVEESGDASPATVVEILGRVGGKQASRQVRCKIISGKDIGKVMRRNVLGPIKVDDILMLKQTEIEASPLRGAKGSRGGRR